MPQHRTIHLLRNFPTHTKHPTRTHNNNFPSLTTGSHTKHHPPQSPPHPATPHAAEHRTRTNAHVPATLTTATSLTDPTPPTPTITASPTRPTPNPKNPNSDNKNPHHRNNPFPQQRVPSSARRERARVRTTGRPRGGHHQNNHYQHHRSTPS